MRINIHSHEVTNALHLLGEDHKIMEKQPAAAFLQAFYEKFTVKNGYEYPLWEYFKQNDFPISRVQDKDAWKRLGAMLAGRPVYLFFEEKEDGEVFELPDGGKISEVLGECYLFPFYISNAGLDFFLAFNDHDFLIAGGEAAAWPAN